MEEESAEKKNVGKNNPFNGMMEKAKDDRRPEFLSNQKGSDGKTGADVQTALKVGETAATMAGAGAVGKVASNVAGAKQAEKSFGSFYTGAGKTYTKGEKGKSKFAKISAGSFATMIFVILGIVGAFITSPIFMIGMIDYNLQKTLGFSPTVAILEKAAKYITGEMLSKGEVPEGYADDLIAAGIDVGQVTASGDFVRTNVYIAGLGEDEKVAANGDYRSNEGNGALAVLFENEIIEAEDFVAAVDSNPRLYAAYSEAADISARFYYSNEVNEIYNDMGLTRHAFYGWESTGDDKKDRENFDKILVDVLDKESNADISECREGEGENGEYTGCSLIYEGTVEGEAEGIISDVASGVKDLNTSGATTKAAQLLNSAVSASEPYKAAAAFMAIEEPIQRARIDGDGPVNEVMNTLSETTVVKYVDVSTGKEVEREASILETPNFAAAISEGTFDKNEALNFSRERINKITGTADAKTINDTIAVVGGQKKSDALIGIPYFQQLFTADESIVQKASDSLSIAMSEKNSELFTSVIGGNRAVEGGSFISNTINSRMLAALPSDAATVLAYSHEATDELARKAEAERATLSPFDISSPNTFMGSIFYSLGASLVQNRLLTSNQAGLTSVVGAVASLAGDAIDGLQVGAIADGSDQSYLTTFGEACESSKSVGSEGDLYCTSTDTIVMKYINLTGEDWEKTIPNYNYEKFVWEATERSAPLGEKDGGVCEKINPAEGIIESIADILGMYDACKGHEDEATGRDLVLTNSNSKKAENEIMAGYTLYDEVKSLLSEEESTASRIKREYYAAHPMDNSAAGRIARISGMSKREAEIALGYADYLVQIANYDPSTRYAFGTAIEAPKRDDLTEFAVETNTELYCFWRGKIEYKDLRERTLIA